ncbi:MAG: putative minor tail protein [Prokaryotic dsDNA virus sp.]|nr:MAG: putative minor tail protein [Prokaryotic dsDNA virus sp.]|tara:strand:+ start:10670 stop:14341 length:3672 start_codon:yes stop_codon:yes gene_type:complete
MAKNIAIDVQIKNIKRVADLKQELKDLRKEQKEHEKYAKSGKFTSKEQEKAYLNNARAIDKNSKSLRGLNKNLKQSTTDSTKSTKATGSLTKSFLKAAGAITLVVGAFRTVSGAISRTIATFTEFEFTMAKVLAVSGATDEEFKALTKTAEELGRTTFFTAEQVGQLQLAYSKLGFTAKEIQDAVKPTLDLATATGTDLARAAQVAGAAVRGFGLDASETERVVDVMAVSFSSSAMDIEKWQTGMTKVAPIAKAAGFSIEDTAAIMSKLSDSGIEASIAGTSLRNILLKMQDPSSDLSKSFGTTIHSLDDLVPAMKKFVAEGGSMADIMEVVDLRQAAAFEQMLTTADGTLALRDELKDANGEGARMAEIVGDTLQGAFLKLKSALQGVSISVMKDFAEGMQSGIEKAAGFFNMLAENSKTITNTIKFLGKLIRVVGLYKLGVLAATKSTKAIRTAKALWIKTNVTLTASTLTLRGAVTALGASIKRLLGSTGIGLLVAFLPEILEFFGLWGEEVDNVADSQETLEEQTKRLTKDYHDLAKPIDALKTKTQQLVRVKKLMNAMIDDEGKLIEDTLSNQKLYNKLKGQAAVLMRDLNKELKDNDQILINEKSSIDDITTAMNQLTESMMNNALISGFEKQLERISEKSANASVAIIKMADDLGYSIANIAAQNRLGAQAFADSGGDYGDPLEGTKRTLATLIRHYNVSKSMYNDLVAEEGEKNVPKNRKFHQIDKLLKETGFKSLDAINEALNGTEKEIEAVTLAFDSLVGEGGIGSLLLKADEAPDNKPSGGPDPIAVTNWEEKTKKALLVVKQKYDEAGASQEEYQIELAATRKSMLEQELAEINALEELNLGQKKRKLDLETQIADATIAENQRVFKTQLEGLEETNREIRRKIIEENTVRGKLTKEGEELLLLNENNFLAQKIMHYDNYGQKIIGIDDKIAQNKQKLHDLQMKNFKDQLKAMGGLGSGLQDLAGDNEKLNKVKEAGILISKIAQGIEKAMLIQEQLYELGLIKKIALKKTDLVLTNLQTGANIGEAASENLSTGSILANTIATVANIIPKAISTILSAFSGPLGILKAIAAFAFIKKVMKMKFEDGGIIASDDKYAKGGMVYGKSHAQGGEKFSAGGRVVELEGGEAVINRKSTAMFRNQLSAMNEAGGGVRFADGGLLTSPQFTNSEFAAQNQLQMRDAMDRQKKVVVVESDITESQSTVSVIQSNASF